MSDAAEYEAALLDLFETAFSEAWSLAQRKSYGPHYEETTREASIRSLEATITARRLVNEILEEQRAAGEGPDLRLLEALRSDEGRGYILAHLREMAEVAYAHHHQSVPEGV